MRRFVAIFLAVALVLTLALPMAAFADKGKGKGKGLKVRGKLEIEGIVTGVNLGASVFTMRLTKHANRAGSDSVAVLVQRATELKVEHKDDDDDDDDDERARRIASINDIRVGDRVKLECFRLDDGRILALKLEIKNRRIFAPPEPQGVVAQGVVTAKSENMLDVVAAHGTTRVLVTPATTVRGHRNSFDAIRATDVVVVQGTVNADGTISAQHIEVVFAGGTQMTGVITAKSTVGPQFLILNNSLAVSVSSDTRIISGGRLRSFDDLHVGRTITVSGDPISISGITVGINARVISF